MQTKQVFLYKPTAMLNPADLEALRDAGFIPVCVDDFKDVRVIDPMNYADRSAVWFAAMEAIAKANSNEGPKTIFGRVLAEKLFQSDLATKQEPEA